MDTFSRFMKEVVSYGFTVQFSGNTQPGMKFIFKTLYFISQRFIFICKLQIIKHYV